MSSRKNSCARGGLDGETLTNAHPLLDAHPLRLDEPLDTLTSLICVQTEQSRPEAGSGRTCVGSLQLLTHTDAHPVSSRYLHLPRAGNAVSQAFRAALAAGKGPACAVTAWPGPFH